MFDVSPTPLEIKPLNPDRLSAVKQSVDDLFLKMKRQQLMGDQGALVTTVLVWAEMTKRLMERVEKLEAAA